MTKQGEEKLQIIIGKIYKGLNSQLAEKDKDFLTAMEILEKAINEIDQRGLR